MIHHKFFVMLASVAALCTATLSSAEEKVAQGFLTLRLDDSGKITMELPKNLLGREMVMGSVVEKTSNGGNAVVGYKSKEAVHFYFTATDSLVLMNECASVRYGSNDENSAAAVNDSHIGAITATFPIDFETRDSSYYKIDVTSLFTSYDERLLPADPLGADSFGGLIRNSLSLRSDLSSVFGVEAFSSNVSVLSKDTFSINRVVLGMAQPNDADNLITAVVRRSIILLPEEPMRPRIADSRIGVKAVPSVLFGSSDRGSKVVYYANRWRLNPDEGIVFYVDTLFTDRMAKAISDGVLAWNDAFTRMGCGEVLKVRPYPSDSTFNSCDLAVNCIKYEPMQNSDIKTNVWTDPRTGEIIGSSVYVPFDMVTALHAKLMFEASLADPELRTSENEADIIYEYLQYRVSNVIGECLGLSRNLGASSAVSIKQLLDPDFTQTVGLSGSIMDRLPANYLATKEDVERGVRLVQTKVGPYDKYAINWLYCDVPGASCPEDERPFLDSLIRDSYNDPLCKYVMDYSMNDIRYSFDPRNTSWDLGDDPFESTRIRIANSKEIIPNLDEWLNSSDPKYQFRPHLNGEFLYAFTFAYRNVLDMVGGLMFSEPEENASRPTFVQYPAEVQKKALEYVLNELNDTKWIDNDDLYRDIFFVRSVSDFITDGLNQDVFVALSKIAFIESITDKVEFSLEDAFDTIIDHILKNVKAGKEITFNGRRLQYMLVSFSIQNANALKEMDSSAVNSDNSSVCLSQRDADGNRILSKVSGYETLTSPAYSTPVLPDYAIYDGLKKIRRIYSKGIRRAPSRELKDEYRYIVMAIDRVL